MTEPINVEPTPVPPGSYCTKCLAPTDLAEFLANDHICNACADQPIAYPLASESHFPVYCPRDSQEDEHVR